MAVFLTGSGLVGYWIAKGLIAEGEDVILYDIKPPQFDQADVKKITFIQGDLLDYPRLVNIFQHYGSKIEGIIHTAAVSAFGSQFLDNPHRSVTINVIGTLNLLEVARSLNVKKIVYTSTCGVYGGAEGPLSEIKTPLNPVELYGASKACAELLGLQYANHWDIDFRCARLYFVYGPPSLPSSLPFIFRVLFGSLEGLDHLRLESGGDQQVDFTYVKDTAKGILLLYKAKTIKNRVFNIAGGRSYNLRDVLKTVKNYSLPTSMEIGPGKISPARGFPIDISLAREELGFEPEYSLEKGVSEYAEWIKKMKTKLNKEPQMVHPMDTHKSGAF
jgi:nucleoside-diphosphate-sugar epimerase